MCKIFYIFVIKYWKLCHEAWRKFSLDVWHLLSNSTRRLWRQPRSYTDETTSVPGWILISTQCSTLRLYLIEASTKHQSLGCHHFVTQGRIKSLYTVRYTSPSQGSFVPKVNVSFPWCLAGGLLEVEFCELEDLVPMYVYSVKDCIPLQTISPGMNWNTCDTMWAKS
jgi:hypothetical protein